MILSQIHIKIYQKHEKQSQKIQEYFFLPILKIHNQFEFKFPFLNSIIYHYLNLNEYQTTLTISNTPTLTRTEKYSFFVQATELQIRILGASGQTDYRRESILNSYLRDLDNPSSQVNDQNIDTEWACVNPVTFGVCKDQNNNEVLFASNLKKIVIPANTFTPYTVVQFQLVGKHTATNRITTDVKVMFFSELDLPGLGVDMYLIDPNQKTINMNEEVYSELLYKDEFNTDVNLLSFSGTIVYENEVVGIIKFDYFKVRFQLWNYYNGFKNNRLKVQVRFSVFNPRFFMPSIQIMTYSLNFPPQNCLFSVNQIDIHALTLEVLYSLKLSNCEDYDQPLQYQFFFYNNIDEKDHEIKNPLEIKRKQLNDLSFDDQIQSYLPFGNIILLAQAIDSKQAIFNVTQQLNVAQINYDEQKILQIIDFRLQLASQSIPPQAITDLSIFSEDLCKRTQFKTSEPINEKKYQIILMLQQLSKQLPQISTFVTLANKAIATLLSSGIQLKDTSSQQKFFTEIDTLLKSQPSQQISDLQLSKDIQKQKLYDSFIMLDSVSCQNTVKDEQFYTKQIEISEQIGQQMFNNFLPNEEQKIFDGEKLSILSHQITSKNLCSYYFCDPSGKGTPGYIDDIGENAQPDTPRIYNMKFNYYNDNPYQNNESFQEITKNITKALNGVAPSKYEVISPSILSSDNRQVVFKKMIALTFDVNDKEKKSMTCLSQEDKKWTQSGCKTIYNEQQKTYTCACPNLSPTTIVDDITALIDNENIKTVFSSDGITNIAHFDNFYDYAVFYILSAQTIVFILLLIKGKLLDAQTQIISSNNNIDKVYPSPVQDKFLDDQKVLDQDDVINLSIEMNIKQNEQLENNEKYHNLNSNEEDNNGFEKKQISNEKVINNNKNEIENHHGASKTVIVEMKRASSWKRQSRKITRTTNFNNEDWWNQIKQESKPSIVEEEPQNEKQNSNEDDLENGISPKINGKNTQVNDKNLQIIKDQQIKSEKELGHNNQINIQSRKDSMISGRGSRSNSLAKTNTTDFRRRSSFRSSSLLTLKKSKSIILEDDDVKPFFSASKLKQILIFHNFFGIFFLYHPLFSRSFRFCVFYIRLVHSLSVAIIFNQSYSYVQQITISIINALMILIIIKSLEFIVQIKKVGKIIVALLLLGVVGFYYYTILAIVSGLTPSESNECLLPFSIFSSIDILLVSSISALIQKMISTKMLRLGELDGWQKNLFEFLQLNLVISNLVK